VDGARGAGAAAVYSAGRRVRLCARVVGSRHAPEALRAREDAEAVANRGVLYEEAPGHPDRDPRKHEQGRASRQGTAVVWF
jgi:hypothetical protein